MIVRFDGAIINMDKVSYIEEVPHKQEIIVHFVSKDTITFEYDTDIQMHDSFNDLYKVIESVYRTESEEEE